MTGLIVYAATRSVLKSDFDGEVVVWVSGEIARCGWWEPAETEKLSEIRSEPTSGASAAPLRRR
jgi:hypothetical protein